MIQIIIVVASVFLFVGTFILNRKIKPKEEIDESSLPVDCINCKNQACLSSLKSNVKNKNTINCNKGDNLNE